MVWHWLPDRWRPCAWHSSGSIYTSHTSTLGVRATGWFDPFSLCSRKAWNIVLKIRFLLEIWYILDFSSRFSLLIFSLFQFSVPFTLFQYLPTFTWLFALFFIVLLVCFYDCVHYLWVRKKFTCSDFRLTLHILSHLSHIVLLPGYCSSFFFVLNLFIGKDMWKHI